MNRLQELLGAVPLDPLSSDYVEASGQLFGEISEIATIEDVPLLLEALRSDKADFVSREMISDPLCSLGGPELLEPLLVALELNWAEGHDNDRFQVNLWALVEAAPELSAEVLREIRGRDNGISDETVDWLLEFCDPTESLAESESWHSSVHVGGKGRVLEWFRRRSHED